MKADDKRIQEEDRIELDRLREQLKREEIDGYNFNHHLFAFTLLFPMLQL